MALSGATRQDTWINGNGLFMQVARQGLVFDTLTEVAADGTLRPELATGWTSSADARVWTFDLRPSVTFHDGARFTADDVVATLSKTLQVEVKALGNMRVAITLDDPDASLPLHLAGPEHIIMPAHAFGGMIGTGLYRVLSYRVGQRVLTKRVREHYKDGRAGWFDEVELTSIPLEPVRGQALGEYLVDAVDLNAVGALADLSDVTFQPDRHRPTQAVSADVMQPSQISHQRPLDNLRAPERWWFG